MSVKQVKSNKAAKSKSPSTAALKRQIADEKLKNDQLTNGLTMMMQKVDSLSEQVIQINQNQLSQDSIEHDKSKKMIGGVLGEDVLDDLPPRPEREVPANLIAVGKELAKNSPVTIRDTVDTENEQIGQKEVREFGLNNGHVSLESTGADADIMVIDGKQWSLEKYEYELFMQEKLLIKVHETNDDLVTPLPRTNNGNISQYFVRGKPIWVRRASIEPLARCKLTTFTQQKAIDENGDGRYYELPHTTLMYPFEVLEDTKKGREWLRGILAEKY